MNGDDQINHPKHYTSHPSGVECIDIVEHLSFNLGNAVKYLFRRNDKGNVIDNLNKALWYVKRENERRTNKASVTPNRPPIIWMEKVHKVVDNEPSLAIAAAIGLLAVVDWSSDWQAQLSAAGTIIQMEINRLQGDVT